MGLTMTNKLDYSIIRNVIRSSPYQQALHRTSVNNDFSHMSKLTDMYRRLNESLPLQPEPTLLEGQNGIQKKPLSDQNQTQNENRKVHTFTATFEVPEYDTKNPTAAVNSHPATNVQLGKWNSGPKSPLSREIRAQSVPRLKEKGGQ